MDKTYKELTNKEPQWIFVFSFTRERKFKNRTDFHNKVGSNKKKMQPVLEGCGVTGILMDCWLEFTLVQQS